jgi:hypothetical protein
MHIISIFEKVEDRLFAACFEGFDRDELDRTLDSWKDAEWLREFFNRSREDLSKFDLALKVKNAVRQTMEEAEQIYDRLIEFSEKDKLDELFKPLDNREMSQRPYEFQKLKAKGERRKSILRLYAVKFRDWYIITGGAIKLTDQMASRPHLKTELRKLDIVKQFLQDEADVEGSFVYLDV